MPPKFPRGMCKISFNGGVAHANVVWGVCPPLSPPVRVRVYKWALSALGHYSSGNNSSIFDFHESRTWAQPRAVLPVMPKGAPSPLALLVGACKITSPGLGFVAYLARPGIS